MFNQTMLKKSGWLLAKILMFVIKITREIFIFLIVILGALLLWDIFSTSNGFIEALLKIQYVVYVAGIITFMRRYWLW